MHSSFYLWEFIASCLDNNTGVVLMYVLESNGSSPGRQGFAMAVSASGQMHGSIGGGIMEHKFVEMCRHMLADKEILHPGLKKQVHDKTVSKDQSGMICSGDQLVFVYPLKQTDKPVVENIKNCIAANEAGTLQISNHAIASIASAPGYNFNFEIDAAGNFLYTEKLGYKQRLSIVGGGHCSLALSKLMADMDFYTVVYDTREALYTIQQNKWAHETCYVQHYNELREVITGGNDHYVVIMTFGYRTDDIAIRALWEKQFTYFGVLGSGTKINKLFSDYIAEGIPESIFEKIYAPVGLPINSRTPAEIAISIAAQIIQVKNKS
jgi:xanthine dehydrogenase accessory factor